jgi:apolipoprotein N-acyltransferase
VWGLIYFVFLLAWLRPFGPPAWIGLSFVEAVCPAFFAAFAAPLLRRNTGVALWGIAALWTLFEQMKGALSFGFTWGDVSLTQIGFPAALQTASWWGGVGLSFLVALGNVALWKGWAAVRAPSGKERIKPLAWMVGFVAVSLLLGENRAVGLKARFAQPTAASVPFGLVQGNNRRALFTGEYDNPEAALETYETLTADLAARGCRYVVWPESVVPEDLHDRYRRLSRLAKKCGIYLLVGAFDHAPPDFAFNSLFGYGPHGRLIGVYHKRKRVPFGEFVPYRAHLPDLSRFGVPSSDVTEGKGTGIIQAGNKKIGVGICFESLIPSLALAQARQGVDALVLATNDSYYGRTPAPASHEAFLRLRAVETGVPGVQAASTGYSFMALPDGEVPQRTQLFEKAALVVNVPPPLPKTLWVRAWWLTWVLLAGVAVGSFLAYPRSADAGRRKQ